MKNCAVGTPGAGGSRGVGHFRGVLHAVLVLHSAALSSTGWRVSGRDSRAPLRAGGDRSRRSRGPCAAAVKRWSKTSRMRRRSRLPIRLTADTASSTLSTTKPVTPGSTTSGTEPQLPGDDRRAAGHRFDHHQAERFGPVDGKQQRRGVAEEVRLLGIADLADVARHWHGAASAARSPRASSRGRPCRSWRRCAARARCAPAISMARSGRFSGEMRPRKAR